MKRYCLFLLLTLYSFQTFSASYVPTQICPSSEIHGKITCVFDQGKKKLTLIEELQKTLKRLVVTCEYDQARRRVIVEHGDQRFFCHDDITKRMLHPRPKDNLNDISSDRQDRQESTAQNIFLITYVQLVSGCLLNHDKERSPIIAFLDAYFPPPAYQEHDDTEV